MPPNVNATDGTSTDYVRVTWSGVTGASYYRVYRNTSNSSSGAASISNWQTSLSFYDRTANPGTTYYYWVKAATSSSGTRASGYGGPDTGWRALSPPTNVNATDGTSTDYVKVTWSFTGVYYRIYRNTSNSSSGASPISNWDNAPIFPDTSANAGTTYYYWVKAATSSSGSRESGFSGSDSGRKLVYLQARFYSGGWSGSTNYSGFSGLRFIIDNSGFYELGQRWWNGVSFSGLVIWDSIFDEGNSIWFSLPGTDAGLRISGNTTSIRVRITATLEKQTTQGGLYFRTSTSSYQDRFGIGDGSWDTYTTTWTGFGYYPSPSYTKLMIRYEDTGGSFQEYGAIISEVRVEFPGW